MEKKIIQPQELYKNPYYSHVIKVPAGTLIFVAGQVARDKDGNTVGKGDMFAQARKSYENLKLALEAAGATLGDVIKTTIFVTNMEAFQKVSQVRTEYFPTNPPANTLVEVRRLAHPDLLFEIEAIAVVK